MTKIEEAKIINDYSYATSRLVTRMIPIIKKTYEGIELVDLLMALPIKFVLKEVDYSQIKMKDGNQATMKDMALGGYIERDRETGNENRLIIFFVLTKDTNMEWKEFFDTLQADQIYSHKMAFIYLHEAMHILLRHYDFYLNETYFQIIRNLRTDLDMDSMSEILNHAFDYWINGYLLEEAKSHSIIHKWQEDGFTGLYDVNLTPKLLTQAEIVQKLTSEAEIKKEEILDSEGNRFGDVTTITINGNSSTTVSLDSQHTTLTEGSGKTLGQNEQEIGEVMDNTRNDMLHKTKGSNSQEMFQKLGINYEVPIDWFKTLKGSIFNVVQQYTNNYDQTWGKIKNKFRHVATLPGKIYYNKEMAVIISIDQSGSMSDSDLEKINYVVTELGKKAVFTEVLLHDHHVASRKKFLGKKFQGIKEYVTTRVACGGTSHVEVFETIDIIKKENPKLKLIYLSFSDNYSDIEQVYDPEVFKGILAYWITTVESNTVNVPGMQISLEHGLLQN